MINQVQGISVQCPYCWERFELLVDLSIESQDYIEDCEVFCRPIDFSIEVDGDHRATVQARHQDE